MHLAGASQSAIARELGIGRTAVRNMLAAVDADIETQPMIDPRQLAAETLVDTLLEARAAAARLDRLADSTDDPALSLRIETERRHQRAARTAAAAQLAAAADHDLTAAPRRPAIDTTTAETAT